MIPERHQNWRLREFLYSVYMNGLFSGEYENDEDHVRWWRAKRRELVRDYWRRKNHWTVERLLKFAEMIREAHTP